MLTKLSIEEIRLGILKRKFSFFELISEYERNFYAMRKLNVDISEYWNEARDQAKKLDNSETDFSKYSLSGIPIAVKDMFLTKNHKTTAASKILENFIAPYESFVTQRLKNSGYIMPFKTNLDEFAMGSSNERSSFGPVINPWMLKDRILRVPGGSSGGSAAAVAAHMCLGSLGTDTAGSIRQPAAFCGIVGFKPTYGRCSRRGVIAFASSLDHPGSLARTVQDATIILEEMAGYDKLDSTSLNIPVPKLSKISENVSNKKIGIITTAFNKMNDEYKNHFNTLLFELKRNGANICDVDLSYEIFETALNLYFILAPAEAASNLARYDGLRYGARGEGKTFEEILMNSRNLFGEEVKRRILIGNFVLQAEEKEIFFAKAIRLRKQISEKMNELFSKFDVLLLPTTPSVAFPLESIRDPVEMYQEDLYTVLADIYGGPCLQLPLCKINTSSQNLKININHEYDFLQSQIGMPMGLQIMAGRENEGVIVEVAKKIESIVQWKGLNYV